jgi:hypothetical protein
MTDKQETIDLIRRRLEANTRVLLQALEADDLHLAAEACTEGYTVFRENGLMWQVLRDLTYVLPPEALNAILADKGHEECYAQWLQAMAKEGFELKCSPPSFEAIGLIFVDVGEDDANGT